ncbi:energy-coupling factor ABC transporter ATP-binding protein [Natranaerobius trueperi]|uniref:Energy-coupling factor ABC transporter ATP-binding protein n=1 Tax=Natranaerobius trueperi TaxID=759412 RepID=A0A226BXW7_9FIRM|nr:ATP-binding cassette domain-containing protein [Natranaerobius trueperi]OWZ83846.1 energy-coupling factor ABC transporter ATP-binding protein [Natranaerobius trueperi]
MDLAVEINDLNYIYPNKTPALTKINLKIKKQKKTAILGTNGSGKTTLIYHLNGTLLNEDGTLKVLDHFVNKKNLHKIRQIVGLLFDNPDNQLFSTTVYGDIAFGPRNLKLDQQEVNKEVEMAMKKVGIEEISNRPPYNLSLGQKKRAAIAGLLAMNPQILACDEPFSGLDPSISKQLRTILDDLKEQGTTLIYSTHDVDLTYAWADEVIIMKEGRVLDSGPVSILRDEELMQKSGLPLPTLARLFKHSKFNPRTIEEASKFIMS